MIAAKSKFNFHVVLDGNYKVITCRQTELVNYLIRKYLELKLISHKPGYDGLKPVWKTGESDWISFAMIMCHIEFNSGKQILFVKAKNTCVYGQRLNSLKFTEWLCMQPIHSINGYFIFTLVPGRVGVGFNDL